MNSYSCVTSEKQSVFGEQAPQTHFANGSLWSRSHNPWRISSHKDGRDTDAHFVNHPCSQHLSVPGWPTFAKHYRSAAFVKSLKHGLGLRFGHRQANNFSVQRTKPGCIGERTADHERTRLAFVSERRDGRVELSAGGHYCQAGCRGLLLLQTVGSSCWVALRHTVALGVSGSRGHQNPVAAGSQCGQHSAVARAAEAATQPIKCCGTVEACDHVEHHPRAAWRCWPSVTQIAVEGINLSIPIRENLLHRALPYLTTKPCESVDITIRNPQLKPLLIHFLSTTNAL